MSVTRRLRGFEFSAAEYAVNPEDVLARAKAYAQIGPDDDLRELEMFLRCKYTGKKMESVWWEPMVGPLENGGRLVGRIGNLVVSGTVAISPKTVEVHMDLPLLRWRGLWIKHFASVRLFPNRSRIIKRGERFLSSSGIEL